MGAFSQNFFAAAIAAPVFFAGAACAETATINLTRQEQIAIDLTREYNGCIRTRMNDPVLRAQIQAYDAAKAAAASAYKGEYDIFRRNFTVYSSAYKRIADRDGYTARIETLRLQYEKTDAPFSVQSVIIDNEIEALQKEVDDRVTAETGLTRPQAPQSPSARVSLEKPEDPVAVCGRIAEAAFNEYHMMGIDAQALLSKVQETYGSKAYLKLTAPRAD